MNPATRLEQAVHALRSEDALGTYAYEDAARMTRSRVLQTLSDRRVRRQRLLSAAVVFLCVSVGSTAWAAVTGYLPRALRAIGLPINVEEAPSAPQSSGAPQRTRVKRAHVRSQAVSPTEELAANALPMGVEPEVVSASGIAPVPRVHEERVQPVSPLPVIAPAEEAPAIPSVPPNSRPDRADVIYELAHQAHFVARNPAEALPLWDAYLRDAPRGRFVPEAEYNRALCLVRLQRRAEAISSLEVIANRADHYRSNEARQILDALRSSTTSE